MGVSRLGQGESGAGRGRREKRGESRGERGEEVGEVKMPVEMARSAAGNLAEEVMIRAIPEAAEDETER